MNQEHRKFQVMDGNAMACGIDAVVLLAGGLRPSPLVRGVGVSVLDLPLHASLTVLDHWLDLLSKTAGHSKQDIESVVVAYTSNSPQPAIPHDAKGLPTIRFMCDQTGLRGPAGTVRDLSSHLDDDATIFIAEAARLFTGDINNYLQFHIKSGADVTVGRNGDGSPAGIYLTTKRTIDLVPTEGFMDLKEQWLSKAVGEEKKVQVFSFDEQAGLPLRTWQQFMNGIRWMNRSVEDKDSSFSTLRHLRFGEDFGKRMGAASIVMDGSKVADSARIVDSVVMPGSIVGDDAVIVRSFIGSGVQVSTGQMVVDSMLRETISD